ISLRSLLLCFFAPLRETFQIIRQRCLESKDGFLKVHLFSLRTLLLCALCVKQSKGELLHRHMHNVEKAEIDNSSPLFAFFASLRPLRETHRFKGLVTGVRGFLFHSNYRNGRTIGEQLIG
ncbi:MAG: hypothetical protein JWM28_1448, partial [Chitinophagaceae bacterium]|nr:hypothetical protein [Chitinophagaceae bacterium]